MGASRLAVVLLTLVVFGIGIILRLHACRDDLWVDELHTAWVVDGAWSDLPARARIGNQAPLYFAIVKGLTDLFGLSRESVRALSVLAGVGLIVTSWWWTWRQTRDHWAALLALMAVSIDSNCIFYASEARPYAVMQLALAWLVVLSMQGGPGWKLILGRGVLAAMAIHLQFTSLIFLASLYAARMVILIAVPRAKRMAKLSALGIEIAVLLMLVAPLAFQVIEVAKRGEAWSTFVPDPSLLGLAKLFPWTPALISLLALFWSWRQGGKPSNLKEIGWLSWLSFSPVELVILFSWLGVAPLFLRRYLLGAEWPILMIPGLVICRFRGATRIAVAGLIVVAISWENGLVSKNGWSTQRLTMMRTEGWSDATRQISQIDPRGDLCLFVASGFIESRQLKENRNPLLREYCRLPVATVYRTPHALEEVEPISSVIPAEPPEDWVQRVVQRRGGIWLLRTSPQKSGAWQAFAKRMAEAVGRQTSGKPWGVTLHEASGITILVIRPLSE